MGPRRTREGKGWRAGRRQEPGFAAVGIDLKIIWAVTAARAIFDMGGLARCDWAARRRRRGAVGSWRRHPRLALTRHHRSASATPPRRATTPPHNHTASAPTTITTSTNHYITSVTAGWPQASRLQERHGNVGKATRPAFHRPVPV